MEQEAQGEQTRPMSREEQDRFTMEMIRALQATYVPGRDRVITPENVYQPAVKTGQDTLEAYQERLFLPGSRVEGLEHLDTCLEALAAGRHVLFLCEHRGNLDASSFNALLRREHPRYHDILERLVYIAGRKLNESSELIKMFSEKYARLIIVPRRDYPPRKPDETAEERERREAFEADARRINRAAFRQLVRLRKAGHIFVLFPLGGRLKPGADNTPVRETVSYLEAFDVACPISMDGNTLPPGERMEEERPQKARVVFRVGPPLECHAFVAAQKRRYAAAREAGELAGEQDFERYAVEQIMRLLECLRTEGHYGGVATG